MSDEKSKTTISLDSKAAEELKSILQGSVTAAEEPDAPERIEIDREQTFDKPSPGLDATAFTQPSLQFQDYAPTEQEKELFLESVLHDKEFQLPINLLNGRLQVLLRSRNTYEQSLAFELLTDMRAAAEVDGLNIPDLILWLQRFSVCMGLLKWGDKDRQVLRFQKAEPGSEEHKANKKRLREAAEEFVQMPYPKWQTMQTAFNVFTIKEKLLLENVANRDFWSPVG
jgi:hypothetical protein